MTDLQTSLLAGLQAQIRPMRAEDLEQVQLIDRLSFSLPWPSSAFRYELEQNKSSLLWVAELVEPTGVSHVIGCLVVWVILDEAHIATLAVHPDYRGLGISRALLAVGLRDAAVRGCLSATLEVRAGNSIAQALYHHYGFAVVGVRPRYYQDNHEDALIMTLPKLDEDYLAWLATQGWKSGLQGQLIPKTVHPTGGAS